MRKITLHDRGERQSTSKHNVVINYIDQNIALCDDIRKISEIRGSSFVECFMIILVKEGHVAITIDGTLFEMGPRSLFVCTPRNTIDDTIMSSDFCSLAIIVSPEYIAKVANHSTVMNVSVDLFKAKHQVASLTKEEADMITGYFELLSTKFNMPKNKFTDEAVILLLRGLSYECTGIIAKNMNINELSGFTSAENLFRSFMKLLHSTNMCYQPVCKYAEMLNISPKHFSSVCKQVTNKTASELIDNEVVTRAKMLLRDPHLSIKEISQQLGFTNQSHFGSFMRKKAGGSPQTFRKLSN